jgi:shikimate kinase
VNARRAIVLVGLMGSGKTTVGKRIAQELGFPFVDSDDVVASVAGKSVREIFSQDGEAVFRQCESDAIKSVLVGRQSSVVLATGGGAVISSENRSLISEQASNVVWLDASVEDLVVRTKQSATRPLLDGDAAATLQSLSSQRSAWYEAVATVRIDTRGKTVAKVCSAVLEAIREGADHE